MSDRPRLNGPEALLTVTGLKTHFYTDEGVVKAVDGVGFELMACETLAIVGESGSGKTVTALSVLRLLPNAARILSGSIKLGDRELVGLSDEAMQDIRGNDIAMIFQDALTALNPVFTVGHQIVESILRHERVSSEEARNRTLQLLRRVGIPEAERRFDQYPHELSGGMRQRAIIAMALSCNPRILIADEPTTALDVTIQAQILSLMNDLRRDYGSSIILITHDLGVVAEMSDRVLVMYGGRAVEYASTDEVFYHAMHPYTWGLLRSLPRLDARSRDERLLPIPGVPPSLINLPPGCHFSPRCRFARDRCRVECPQLTEVRPDHLAACHFSQELFSGEGPVIDGVAHASAEAGGGDG